MKQAFKRWLFNLTALCGSLLIVFLIGELAIRIIYGDKFSERPVFFKIVKNQGWLPTKNLDNTYYGPDYSFHVKTDKYGYRIGSRGSVSKDSSLIVLIGDSVVFGWSVSDDDCFASVLDKKVASLDKNLRVVNLGVPGHGTLEMAERYKSFLKNYDPRKIKAVFVFHHWNDANGNIRYLMLRSGFLEPKVDPYLKPRSPFHLINFLNYKLSNLGFFSENEKSKHETILSRNLGFSMQPTKKTKGYIKLSETWKILKEKIDPSSWNYNILRTKHIPKFQKKIIAMGIDRIDKAVSTRQFPIIHALVNTAPKWYDDELKICFTMANADAENTYYIGELKTDPAKNKNMINQHSGKHFTVEYNKEYAEILFGMIKNIINNRFAENK